MQTLLVVALVVQFVTLIVVVVLLLRKPAMPVQDARLGQMPDQLVALDARSAALDGYVRDTLAQIRRELADDAQRTREAGKSDFSALRTEVTGSITGLGNTLQTGLTEFRADNAASSETLRMAVKGELTGIGQRMDGFIRDFNASQIQSREALNNKLNELGQANVSHQEKLRQSVTESLRQLNSDNTKKLEEMRLTVDEKLHATLQTRLTESFGQVTDQLTKVHAGLGEMTKLSAGVDDLSRIFTNVKSRGTIGEVLLENLLKQMLAPSQYVRNPKVKPGTGELVEFAVKLPTPDGETLLPIDSKFPRDLWERLETAYQTGSDDVLSAGRAFETGMRNEAKKIFEKYIAPPVTTGFAIMFVPTEGLYAEVMRRDGLQSEIQQNYQVTIAGPSTLSAILNSFQMGFTMLQLQKKGDMVWKVLADARKEFGTFEVLMGKMTDDVKRVQGTIDKLGVRTRAINRTLRDVTEDSATSETLQVPLGISGKFDGLLPMLAASEEDDA